MCSKNAQVFTIITNHATASHFARPSISCLLYFLYHPYITHFLIRGIFIYLLTKTMTPLLFTFQLVAHRCLQLVIPVFYLRTHCTVQLYVQYSTSNVTVATEVRSARVRLFAGTWRLLMSVITTLYYVAIIFHRPVWYRALSLCVFDTIKVLASSSSHRLPLCQNLFPSRPPLLS